MTTERHVHLVSGYFRSGKTEYIQSVLVPLYSGRVVVLESILDDVSKLQRGLGVVFESVVNPLTLVRNLKSEGITREQLEEQMKLWTLDEYIQRLTASSASHDHVIGENHSVYASPPKHRRGMVEKLRATGKFRTINAYWMDTDVNGCFQRMLARDKVINPKAVEEATLQEFVRIQGGQPTLAEGYDSVVIVRGTPGHYEEQRVVA